MKIWLLEEIKLASAALLWHHELLPYLGRMLCRHSRPRLDGSPLPRLLLPVNEVNFITFNFAALSARHPPTGYQHVSSVPETKCTSDLWWRVVTSIRWEL